MVEIVVRVITLYEKFGMIKFNMEYAARVLGDPAGMGLFLGVLLLSGKPYLLALASVALAELVNFTQDIGQACYFPFIFIASIIFAIALQYGRANLPLIQSQLGPMLG